MTDLRTYLADKLKADGYDGLCDPGSSCWCGLDDLAPCCLGQYGESLRELNCQPAYRVPCTESDSCCDFCDSTCQTDFYTTKKPEG